MRLGLLPSQKRELQRALKKAKAFDRFRSRTRRAFVAGGFAALATAAVSFWAGVQTTHGEPAVKPGSQLSKRQQLARRLAAASDAELQRDRNTFLQTLEEVHADPIAWVGFRRLAGMAVAAGDRALATRLLTTLKLAEPAAEVDDLFSVLSELKR